MKLVIGGYCQGKLSYVKNQEDAKSIFIFDGKLPDTNFLNDTKNNEKTLVINHFHEWVRKKLLDKKNPEEEILDFLIGKKNIVIISDEIGSGIVPIDKFEREYRERTGRILVKLASLSDEVVRVVCGIGQKIK